MSNPGDFTCAENWSGGYYELLFRLGRSLAEGSTGRLLRALSTLWAASSIDGPFPDQDEDPARQTRIELLSTGPHVPTYLYGRATLPNGADVVCRTLVVRGEDPEFSDDEYDWLYLCLPLGSLAKVDARIGGFPFYIPTTTRPWREPIDLWLTTLAEQVAADTGFDFGIIAFEADDYCDKFNGDSSEDEFITFLAPSPDGLIRLAPQPWIDQDRHDALIAEREMN